MTTMTTTATTPIAPSSSSSLMMKITAIPSSKPSYQFLVKRRNRSCSTWKELSSVVGIVVFVCWGGYNATQMIATIENKEMQVLSELNGAIAINTTTTTSVLPITATGTDTATDTATKTNTIITATTYRSSPVSQLQQHHQQEKTESIQTHMDENGELKQLEKEDEQQMTTTTEKTATIQYPNDFFSMCVLMKDDNDILPEWIIYHYHTLNVRHFIIGIDPTSKTSPMEILNRFRSALPDLRIEEWSDEDYMPDFFTKEKRYDLVPTFVGPSFKNATTSRWHNGTESAESVEQDWKTINNHRFRQRTLVHHCAKRFHALYTSNESKDNNQKTKQNSSRRSNSNQQRTSNWMAHVDTDEYIVVNPKLRILTGNISEIVPPTASSSSIHRFIEDMLRNYPKRIRRQCISMPALVIGSLEKNVTTTSESTKAEHDIIVPSPFNPKSFETIRYRYHPKYDDQINGFQKTIIDLSTLPRTDELLVGPYAFNPHRPSEAFCEELKMMRKLSEVRKYPLTLNHYLGSFERYNARSDKRRSRKQYDRKANLASVRDDGWIGTWLNSFVQRHGSETLAKVLGDPYLIKQQA